MLSEPSIAQALRVVELRVGSSRRRRSPPRRRPSSTRCRRARRCACAGCPSRRRRGCRPSAARCRTATRTAPRRPRRRRSPSGRTCRRSSSPRRCDVDRLDHVVLVVGGGEPAVLEHEQAARAADVDGERRRGLRVDVDLPIEPDIDAVLVVRIVVGRDVERAVGRRTRCANGREKPCLATIVSVLPSARRSTRILPLSKSAT